MKRAKVVHDNLNAGGGSERLAFAAIELLNEMNFVIDLATLQKPNLKRQNKILEMIHHISGNLIK
jgi:hypothetical protein